MMVIDEGYAEKRGGGSWRDRKPGRLPSGKEAGEAAGENEAADENEVAAENEAGEVAGENEAGEVAGA